MFLHQSNKFLLVFVRFKLIFSFSSVSKNGLVDSTNGFLLSLSINNCCSISSSANGLLLLLLIMFNFSIDGILFDSASLIIGNFVSFSSCTLLLIILVLIFVVSNDFRNECSKSDVV